MALTKRESNNSRSERLAKRLKQQPAQVPKTPTKPLKSINMVTTPSSTKPKEMPTTPVQALREAKLRFRRCSTPKKLIGRESERSIITTFINKNVIGKQGNSMYISGCLYF